MTPQAAVPKFGISGSVMHFPKYPFGRYDIINNTPVFQPGPVLEFSAMSCCGIVTMGGLSAVGLNTSNWATEASFLEGLFLRTQRPGHIMYITAPFQEMDGLANVHTLMKKIGSRQLGEFYNLNYSINGKTTPNHLLKVWLVDINAAVGPYLDVHGNALKEPPKPKPVEVPEVKKAPASKTKTEKVDF